MRKAGDLLGALFCATERPGTRLGAKSQSDVDHASPRLATKYDVHPNMIAGWKNRLAEEAAGVFERGTNDQDKAS